MPGYNQVMEHNGTSAEIHYTDLYGPLMCVFVVLYAVIFVLGLGGNSLVLYVVSTKRSMQTNVNLFIANLALADTLLCLFSVSLTPLSFLIDSWIFGEVFCHISPSLVVINVLVSTLTLTAISVDRYGAILKPLNPPTTFRMCLLKIIAIWILSVTISIPHLVFHRVIIDETGEEQCIQQYDSAVAGVCYMVILFILQFVVPSVIITYCYVHIFLTLHRRAKSPIGDGALTADDNNAAEIQKKRRITKMLVTVVLVFVCCWLPLNVTLLIRQLHVVDNGVIVHLFFPVHVLAMSSTVYNPFIYALMSEKFQKEFKLCWGRLCASVHFMKRNNSTEITTASQWT